MSPRAKIKKSFKKVNKIPEEALLDNDYDLKNKTKTVHTFSNDASEIITDNY